MDRNDLTIKEAIELAKVELEKIGSGWELLKIKQYTHRDDRYLWAVLAYSKVKDEYVSWVWNASTGGMNWGRYGSLEYASQKFNERG